MKRGTNIVPENTDNYTIRTYHPDGDADFYPENIRLEKSLYIFDLKTPSGTIRDIKPGLPGKFNLENAIAALAVAYSIGIMEDEVRKAMLTFYWGRTPL
jgi:UDP-N-acetylmuramate--alanine ligase